MDEKLYLLYDTEEMKLFKCINNDRVYNIFRDHNTEISIVTSIVSRQRAKSNHQTYDIQQITFLNSK